MEIKEWHFMNYLSFNITRIMYEIKVDIRY